MAENEAWVTHTYKVIARANSALAAAVDMETGMRGYLLAGIEEFLEPYTGGNSSFFKITSGLKETVSDNNAQVTLLSEIDTNINEWKTNVTEPTIKLRRAIGSAKPWMIWLILLVKHAAKSTSTASAALWPTSWPKKRL